MKGEMAPFAYAVVSRTLGPRRKHFVLFRPIKYGCKQPPRHLVIFLG